VNVSVRLVGGHGRARYRQGLLRYTDLEVAPLKVPDQCQRFRRRGSFGCWLDSSRIRRSSRCAVSEGVRLSRASHSSNCFRVTLCRTETSRGSTVNLARLPGSPAPADDLNRCDRDPNGMKQGTSLDGDGMLDSIQVCVRNSRIFTLQDYHLCLLFASRSTMAFVAGRYIRASELRTFSFCRRAWFLERRGIVSALQSARTFGTTDHQQHRQAAAHATAAARASSALLIAGVIAFAVAGWWWLR
jgi:hypothetical protein